MKLNRTFSLVIIAGIAIILLIILVVFIPSRGDQASNPTLTPSLTIFKTNTPLPTATIIPTQLPTNTPTLIPPTIAPTATATFTPTATPTLTLVPTLAPTLAPSALSQPTSTQSPPSSFGFTLLYSSPSIFVGGTAQVTISTAPGASCALTVYDPRGQISEAPGLGSKKAGVDGRCTWIWTVSHSDFKGTGFFKVDANGMTQTFVYTLQ